MSSSDGRGRGFLEQWDRLRREAAGRRLAVPVLPELPGRGAVRVGVDEEGRPLIWLPVMGSLKEDWEWRGRNLVGRATVIHPGGKATRVLEVACLERELEQPFGEFCVGVVDEMRSGATALQAFRVVLRRFRQLFAPDLKGTWDRERTAGFLAELLVLERLVRLGCRDPECWRGPRGGARDFELPGLAIECKAGVGQAADRIVIHGLRQLELRPGEVLFLVHHVFEERNEGGLTVGDVIRRLDSVLGGTESWRSLLAEAGVEPEGDASAPWNRLGFDLARAIWYEVKDGFPRLAPDLLAKPEVSSGLRNVRYHLEVRDLVPFEVAGDMAEERIRSFLERKQGKGSAEGE